MQTTPLGPLKQTFPKISKEKILQSFKLPRQKNAEVLEGLFDIMAEVFSKEPIEPENYFTSNDQNPNEAILENVATPKPMRLVTKKKVFVAKSPFISSGYVEDPTLRVWYYLDESNQIQGPFTTLEMDHWFDNGYFFNELLIRLREKNEFVQLIQLFGKVELINCYVPASDGVRSDGLKRDPLSSSKRGDQRSVFNFGFDEKAIQSPSSINKESSNFERNQDKNLEFFQNRAKQSPSKNDPYGKQIYTFAETKH